MASPSREVNAVASGPFLRGPLAAGVAAVIAALAAVDASTTSGSGVVVLRVSVPALTLLLGALGWCAWRTGVVEASRRKPRAAALLLIAPLALIVAALQPLDSAGHQVVVYATLALVFGGITAATWLWASRFAVVANLAMIWIAGVAICLALVVRDASHPSLLLVRPNTTIEIHSGDAYGIGLIVIGLAAISLLVTAYQGAVLFVSARMRGRVDQRRFDPEPSGV